LSQLANLISILFAQELSTLLRTIYDLALRLQALEEKLHAYVDREVGRRADLEKHIKEHGTNNELEEQNRMATKEFETFLSSAKVGLRVLAQNYQDMVKKFLLLLASQADISLQLLSSRLDFNDNYKRQDNRLAAPLTFQHKRRSEICVPQPAVLSTFRTQSEPL